MSSPTSVAPPPPILSNTSMKIGQNQLEVSLNPPHMSRTQSQFSLPSSGPSSKLDYSAMASLRKLGLTTGLIQALSTATRDSFPLRIWVVDNSGSMRKEDGHRMDEDGPSSSVSMIPCSRWDELRQCVSYHVELSALLQAPSAFRFLNDPGPQVGPQQFGIAEKLTGDRAVDEAMLEREVSDALNLISKEKPYGVTPLTRHLNDIRHSIGHMSDRLAREGEKVCIVLATDGLPTDEKGKGGLQVEETFVEALRALEGLPVWIVIRLCTDEAQVVNYYNSLDSQLELSIEVLEDIVDEAKRVYKFNRWLNYALPLHRCRELGFQDRVMDMIDERPLTKDELRDFCSFLFGTPISSIPDPAEDWVAFLRRVEEVMKEEREQWNPIKKEMRPWIKLETLDKIYGDGEGSKKCCIM